MSYKKNASANRDALFGGADDSVGKKSRSNRDAGLSSKAPPPSSSGPSSANRPVRPTTQRRSTNKKPALRGEARAAKLKQAEGFRDQANQCMKSGIFQKPDPVAASTYYKRAAEAYQQAGDCDRLERLYRQESATCNLQIGAWASAATDSIRVAELLIPKNATVDDIQANTLPDAPEYPTIEKRRFAASVFYKQAATAYTESELRME